MGLEIRNPNTCIRGCCHSDTIPLHLPSSSYTLLHPIARGGESVVYDGIMLDGERVAVKKPVLSTSEDINRFHKELQLLCKLNHEGIATLVAAHARPPNYMFFFKFYEGGNLSHKLHVEEWSPSIGQALMITRQLANSLQYLHHIGIVHRDVKPANVLLDKSMRPHLADFGLSEYKEDLTQVTLKNWKSSGKPTGGFHKKNMVGTLIYMAPEVLRKEIQTEKSDVYSFGITINELFTGVVPYTDLRTEAQAHTVLEMNYTEQQLTAAVVSDGLRPALAGTESGAPARLLSLIERCWDADTHNRPSFDDIITELDSIIGDNKCFTEVENVDTDDESTNIVQPFQEEVNWLVEGENILKNGYETAHGVKSWTNHLDDSVLYLPVLSWGSFATRGRRETMEDTHFLMPRLWNEDDTHIFGIFDGHRGGAAAEFSVRALPTLLQTMDCASSPTDALKVAFTNTDVAFRKELNSLRKSKGLIQKDYHPGCTAIAALIVQNKLFVANAGDCRAILCRAGSPYPLSKDHVASCLEERERVTSVGGQVKWQLDTWRVGPAALQVTRSIGDDDLKPGVTAEPEVTETTLSDDDEYLVMASDGLWDVVSSLEVVSIIKDTVKEPGMCSKRLATEAAERGSSDNITVIVVFLRPVSTAERIY
ncbi:protein kinase family protein / protein phosphatase 2C (PP2C) family protein [Artemisia annua]|uniref:Protein kinase family protein / protein phosphatase 2C (PP2C) family protein n=1 Tax=Artemisia annua TaxID=35608 RepID=A0A2U1MIQ8_ARTAN|nr:protein kinase family protein / protein phosphatase 2C (PP2C) family protein [Artemisia annua]